MAKHGSLRGRQHSENWPIIIGNYGFPVVAVHARSSAAVLDLGKRVNISVRSADANGIWVLDVKAFVPPVSGGQ